METFPSDATVLLRSARSGDARAADLLFARVYGDLRRLAGAQVARERHAFTLNATGLVHEAYVKLVGTDAETYQDRDHFLGVAARAMRQILTDHARARLAAKRGGGSRAVTLATHHAGEPDTAGDAVLAVNDALERLAGFDADLARLVELRFFGGLEVDEAASVLGVSPRTAARMWARAKAHLRVDLVAL